MAINVPLTNSNSGNLSRLYMLEWVNDTLKCEIGKIEELCQGAAYCQLMDMIFPNTIPMKRVKFGAVLEHEFLHNLKIFQNAFTKNGIDKTVPIEKLIKARFQDNFEFLQWFKKFFDKNYQKRVYDPLAARCNAQLGSMASKPIRKAISTPALRAKLSPQNPIAMETKILGNNLKSKITQQTSIQRMSTPKNINNPASPSTIDLLSSERGELGVQMKTLQQERDFYFSKLRRIEILIQHEEEKGDLDPKLKNVLDVLYSSESIDQTKKYVSADNLLL